MARKIFKTTYRVVVFSKGSPVSTHADLADVLREMDSGEFIGEVTRESAIRVPLKNVKKELLSIGNDGEFFEEWR